MGKEENKERLTVGTVIKSIFSGNILMLLRVDRLLPYILFLFVLGWVNIFLNYKIEQTMVAVENNKEVLEFYRNSHAKKTYEFAKSCTKSSVKAMLMESGSTLAPPEKPAEKIYRD